MGNYRKSKKQRFEKQNKKFVLKEEKKLHVHSQLSELSKEDLLRYLNTTTVAFFALSTFHSCIDSLSGTSLLIDKVEKIREALLDANEVMYREAMNRGEEEERNDTQRAFDNVFRKLPFMSREQIENFLNYFHNLEVDEKYKEINI